MKFTKSLLEAALGLRTQKIAPHSPQGNYVIVNESKEAEGHLWQAGEHKKAAEKHEPNSKQWHAAMAAHHESKAEYYHHKGMRDLSDKHADKAEAHLMKMHESVEIDESLMEGTVTVVRKDNGGHHRITVGKTAEGETFVSSKFDTSSDPKKPSGNGSSQNLANYVDSRHGDGTAKKRAKLHSALVAAHATGDKKKVLDAVKAHGYSHHDWQLHEGTELPADKSKWTAQDFRKHFESKNSKKTPQDKEHEAWERKYNANRVNESEKYTDENGVTWNDEGDSDHGHTNWGRGPMNHYGSRRYRSSGYKKPAAQKHYHSVPYKDKEHAKSEGMKWDGDKRKWYHTDAGKSATSKFKKLTEEESLDEARSLESLRRMHRDEHENGGGTDASWAKLERIRALVKKHYGKAAHDKMVDDTDDYAAYGGSGPARLKEEESLDEARSLESLRRMHRDEHENGGGTDASWAKMHAIRALVKKHYGKAAHDKMVDDTDDYAAYGGSGPARLKEEEVLDEEEKKKVRFDHRDAAMAGVMHSDDAPRMKLNMQHDFYSSKNGDKIQGTVHTVSKDRVMLKANTEYHKDHGKFHTFKFAKSYDRMNEETLDEANKLSQKLSSNAAANKDKPATAYALRQKNDSVHRVAVTISDPDHEMVSKRKETYLKHIRIKGASGPINAVGTAKRHFKKLGYKVHDAEHVGEIKEDLEIITEEHATREQAEKRMSEIEKKHPMAKHTVMQGRRSGKWHVVRHTGGGMHVVESADDVVEDCGLESKADFDSKKKAAIVKSTVKQKKETK